MSISVWVCATMCVYLYRPVKEVRCPAAELQGLWDAHMGAGNCTWVISDCTACSRPLSHLFSPWDDFSFFFPLSMISYVKQRYWAYEKTSQSTLWLYFSGEINNTILCFLNPSIHPPTQQWNAFYIHTTSFYTDLRRQRTYPHMEQMNGPWKCYTYSIRQKVIVSD